MEAARKVLGIPRRERLHMPEGRPTCVVHRHGEQWGVAMLHGGREIAWYEPEEARREGARLIELANLAANPGSLPAESFG